MELNRQNQMKNFLLFAFVLLSIASSCNDDDLEPRPGETPLETLNRLVPATQTGAGTFGCLVNGEVWIPESDGVHDITIDARIGTTNPNNMTIQLMKEPISDDRSQRMTIGTVYRLGEKIRMKTGSNFVDFSLPGNCRKIHIDTTLENYIIVDRVDASRDIMSGRFACTMQEDDCPDTKIEITEGRFDVIYRY